MLLSRKIALHSAIGLIFWSQLALPTTQVYSFSIPSNTLSAALNAWAKVTNRDFISSPDTLRNIQAPALEGIFSGIAAIDALLINTNLKYKEQADGSILIYIKPLAISPTDKRPTEEILVTGIRGSLRRALEVKRDATNIVDAISSLDISKFPDTNLAEALQRITGVSIDRINNEGNKVTVRGLGPNFNLVTLNGRHMPVTAIPEISSLNSLAPATRSFEFINVSADSIDSVEVHKTVQANDLSGGIGATLDIKTHRPLLDTPKLFSLGIKNVFDTTTTDKPTQEISTAFNQTLSDNTFGVFFSGIFQERNSTIEEANINGWVGESTAFSEWYSQNNFEVSNLVTEDLNQNSDGLSWAPLSHYFSTSDIKRQRKNAQLTFQYAPSEKIQSTLDINYQGFKASPKTQQFGTNFFGIPRDKLFGENLTSSINQNGTTTILTKKDAIYHFQKSEEQFINKTKSLGVNINYLFSNELNFTFDAHSAHAQAQRLIKNLQVLELSASAINFNANYDIPSMTIELNDPFTAKNLTTITEPQAYTTFQQSMKNQITQFRFQGDFDNHGNEWFSNLKFGIDRIEEDNHASVHEDIFETHWNLNFEFLPENNHPSNFFKTKNMNSMLNKFSGGTHNLEETYTTDFSSEIANTRKLTESSYFECFCTEPLATHFVSEISHNIYIQTQIENHLIDMPMTTLVGIRYEQTQISVSSLMSIPESIDWIDPEFTEIKYADQRAYQSNKDQYASLLPSFNTRLELPNNLVTRAAISRSIARPDLMQVRNQTTILSSLSSERAATRGNTSLKPYVSDNIDLSLDWYYAQNSYLSLGYFNKNIHNFTTIESSKTTLYNLNNVYIGERAETARNELRNEGLPLTNENVLNRIIENNGGNPTPNDDGETVVSSNETDPPIIWTLRKPVNGQSAKLNGWEFAAQHLFGDSGWGTNFNYTLVDSDTNYNIRTETPQFAIPGISDTLNFVGFYEKNKIEIRIAYNWRDQFLNSLTTFTGDHPQFTEAYEQWDLSASYNIGHQFTIFFEAINITQQNQRIFSRYKEQLISAKQFGAIYNLGFNYTL